MAAACIGWLRGYLGLVDFSLIFSLIFLYGISGSCSKIPATAFRRCCGAGPCDRDVDECAGPEPDRAWVYLQRASRDWEDDDCAHSGDGAELPERDRVGGAADSGALR